MSLNLNNLAKQIAKLEGGKVNLSIAQIREVLGWTFYTLGEYTDAPGHCSRIARRSEVANKCIKFYRDPKRRERAKGKDK
ncbi:hypothetical protein LCGC14_2628850 [marine sediment metagenome]|uniref:Uncharacterized protein n=1 Tax=marine sediment metagenome TaxID=412755 RepID=A0A0F9CTD5_9ZZZZ